MKKNLLLSSLFVFGICLGTFAQEPSQKAKIYIKKSDNGKVTEIEKEIPITEGADLEKLLNELGVWEDFENLSENETIELNVRRFENGDWMNALELAFSGQENSQAFLGVMIKNDDNQGVRITEIVDDSAAATSELRSGDIILEIDSEDVTSTEKLIELIQSKKAGDEVSIRYLRDGKKKKTKVALGEKQNESFNFDFEMPEMQRFEFPEVPAPPHPGNLKWMECDQQKAFLGVSPDRSEVEEGVMLGAITEGSAAEKMGLKSGDVVKSINDTAINSFRELADLVGAMKPGDEININADRQGKAINFSGELGSRNFGNKENIVFFRDFKGMDEDGDMVYDFEYDFEADPNMSEEELEIFILEQDMRLEEFKSLLAQKGTSIEVTIEIDSITEEEATKVNENAEPALRVQNDLAMDNFSFYPNPSAGQFNLKFDLAEKGNLEVYIYDQMGSVVYSERMSGFSGKYNKIIDLEMFSDGLYFMQIMQGDKSFSKKLIKG